MTQTPVRGVLISRDAALREAMHGAARDSQGGLMFSMDIAAPFAEFTAEQVTSVQAAAPAAVFLDLQDDVETGLALAKHLSAGKSDLAVVLIGHPLSAEALLAAMRAGVTEFIPLPLEPQSVLETLPRIRAKLPAITGGGGAAGRVVAIRSAKGGSGGTMVATNLAIDLHRRTRQRTLLVDLDTELGEVSLHLGVQPQFNFVDLIQNFHRVDSGLLSSYIEQHPSGVHLLSAPYQPDRATSVTEDQVRQILAYLRAEYDWIVVDAKGFGPANLAAFEQADDVVVVATVDLPSLRNIQRGLPLLRRVLPRGDDQVRLVINRYDPNHEVTLRDVQKTLGLKVFATIANDYEAVITSINNGKPLVLGAVKSAVGRDLHALGSKILGGQGLTQEAPTPTGLMGKLGAAFRGNRTATDTGN